MAESPGSLSIDGKKYVVLPRSEYQRLVNAAGPAALKNARKVLRSSIGASLRDARETAGLTQVQLAAKLRVTQPMVAAAESGKGRVAERYVARVLKACGLPKDWSG